MKLAVEADGKEVRVVFIINGKKFEEVWEPSKDTEYLVTKETSIITQIEEGLSSIIKDFNIEDVENSVLGEFLLSIDIAAASYIAEREKIK